MDRGTAVHRFFELWDFGGDNADLPDRVLDESDFDPQQREALRAQLAHMAERFREDPLHARLAADDRLARRPEIAGRWRRGTGGRWRGTAPGAGCVIGAGGFQRLRSKR